MTSERIWWSGGFTVLLLGVLLIACGPAGDRFGRDRRDFASNGERIYFTATSSFGQEISYDGGPGRGMMMRGRLACADCHGEDGEGGRGTMMMETFEAPDITWPKLTGEHGDHAGEEEHPPYTVETLKRAITTGINPAGERLDSDMPRWQMSDEDLNDLVDYVKTLGERHDDAH